MTRTHRNTHNEDGSDALRESQFSAYLNIALNNRSREGWGRTDRAGSEGEMKNREQMDG